MTYHRVASFKTAGDLHAYLAQLHIDLAFDPEIESGPGSPLAQPYRLPDGLTIGNRFCVLPMEGWDGATDGRPSELTFRRWQRFGKSGAQVDLGRRSIAVRRTGRANPNQLMINEHTLGDLIALRDALTGTSGAQR
jgi:hypothetical protein